MQELVIPVQDHMRRLEIYTTILKKRHKPFMAHALVYVHALVVGLGALVGQVVTVPTKEPLSAERKIELAHTPPTFRAMEPPPHPAKVGPRRGQGYAIVQVLALVLPRRERVEQPRPALSRAGAYLITDSCAFLTRPPI